MSEFLELPVISERTSLEQIQRYLYRTVERLNVALGTMESTAHAGSAAASGGSRAGNGGGQDGTSQGGVSFSRLKDLIIKSADIVEAFYETISRKLEGKFVAQSDFGTYAEQTEQRIEETSTEIERLFTNIQQVITDVEDVEHTLIEVNAHIKSGLLFYDENGAPVYGLEIGQRNQVDGEEVFNKYARFTSDKLSFYDSNGFEVAYISDKKLYITHIEVTGNYYQGGFVDMTQPDGSVVTKWIGG